MTYALAVFGVILAVPFVIAILRAPTPARAVRFWLWEAAAALAIWGLAVLVFHSGLIAEQRSRVLAAAIINALWAALVLAVALGAVTAVIQALRLRAGLRTGK